MLDRAKNDKINSYSGIKIIMLGLCHGIAKKTIQVQLQIQIFIDKSIFHLK